MREMASTYFKRSTNDLARLRSQKYVRVLALRKQQYSYFNIQELRKLEQQIKWIDAVIESRKLQTSFE